MPSPYQLPDRWFEDCKELEEAVLKVLPEEELALRIFVLNFIRSLPTQMLEEAIEYRKQKSTPQAPATE